MKKTEEQYKQEWIQLGLRFGYGYQVTKHITNSYKDKHKGTDYAEALISIRKEAEKKLVEVNRTHKFWIAEFVRNISRNTGGIETSQKISDVAEKDLPKVTAAIRRTGYLKGIISACNHLKPEQLKEWVEYEF